MQRKLSFEHTPPLSIPLRFFLTAPLFGVLAGLLLLWYGPQALTGRWSPLTLALTHLLTLGLLTMSMTGALIQLLQVVVGIEVPRVRLTAAIVHGALLLGTCALTSGFLFSAAILLQLALVFLPVALLWLLGACLIGMWRVKADNVTFAAMRLALVALCLTAGLGAVTTSALMGLVALPLVQLTNLHVAWGLLGWVGLLVIGVAYQVVPMFLVTQVYPLPVTRYLAKCLFGILIFWSALNLLPSVMWHSLSSVLSVLVVAALAIFAAVTMGLLWQRKRRVPDSSILFWYLSMGSLLAGCAIWLVGTVRPELAEMPSFALVLGVLFIVGFGYSVINGMLYKIVPFLIWYHLQSRLTDIGMKAPNIRKIIPEHAAGRQFYAHLFVLFLMVPAAIFPDQLARLAGAMFVASSLWLWINLLRALMFYRAALIK